MTITIEYTEVELRKLVEDDLIKTLGTLEVDFNKIQIQVKSKQNYKSEWETASFRARYTHTS